MAARGIVALVAIYLLGLGAATLAAPHRVRAYLLGFATTASRHYAELAARLLAGGALLILAETSGHATVLSIAGWVLLATTVMLALIPWRVHGRFAAAAVPQALRYLPWIGLASAGIGAALLGVLLTHP